LRVVSVGLPVGIFFGVLGFAESGSVVPLVALTVLGPLVYGIAMARRMARFWPGASRLSGADRVAVARAARRGENVGEARLAHPVLEYSHGLRDAHEQAHRYRWVVPVVAALSLILALSDSFFGSNRLAVVSWVWVVIIIGEMSWWPRTQANLLSNAERAQALARQALAGGS
jgi:hypothetical protein